MITYRRVHTSKGVVAYAPENGTSVDHLFLFAAADPMAEPPSFGNLSTLVTRWNQAAGTPASRTLFFCQHFDLSSLSTVLDVMNVTLEWGKMAYWTDAVFGGGTPSNRFPDGSSEPIRTGVLEYGWIGKSLSSLDDFTITANDESGELSFELPAGMKGQVLHRGDPIALHNQTRLVLPLPPKPGFVAGAFGLTVDWPQKRTDVHPLRLVGMVYQARPEQLIPGETVPCPTWLSELADEVDEDPTNDCLLLLDPRDNPSAAQWLRGTLNSRLDSRSATLKSSLFGTKGQRLQLKAEDGAVARLGFLFDSMDGDEEVHSIQGGVIFHPEGKFALSTRGGAVTDTEEKAGIGSLDVLTGGAATEFVDLAAGAVTHIHFTPGKPAFFTPDPDAKELLSDKKQRVITSFASFSTAGQDVLVDFYSEPATSPLFAPSSSNESAGDLQRMRLVYGAANEPLPIFPWAGFREKDQAKIVALESLEVTHLSRHRRRRVTRGANSEVSMGNRVGVTPQGVLAEVAPDGRYTKLYFGNSDSQSSDRVEFSISIALEESEFLNELQQALSGSQLFLVFDRTDVNDLKKCHPEDSVFIRGFRFDLKFSGGVGGFETDPDRTVLLVKFFKGKSLKELIADPTTWGCRRFLARDGDAKGIEEMFHLDRDPTQKIPDHLREIVEDREWQGVLALNLRFETGPPVVESLQPGVVGLLRVHHFGLNSLPIRNSDLKPSPSPRPGSAFGLIHYRKPENEDPKAPVAADEEPGESGPGQRSYSFIVNEVRLAFQNSQIADFHAEVAIGFTHVFWDKSVVTTDPGQQPVKAITLIGSYERRTHGDQGTEDVFSLRTSTGYLVSFSRPESFLRSLKIQRAQLSVESVDRTSEGALKKLTVFIGVDAELVLAEKLSLPLFKVKAIRLRNFGFGFTWVPETNGTPQDFGFGFKADGISADIEFDPPSGSSSLMELLPLKLKGMSIAISKLLDLGDLGFQAIDFGGLQTTFHFGFVFELDLGFLGKLAGDMRGMRVPMILGWRGGGMPGVALGVKFPEFDGKVDIGIQQFIRLRAKKLELKPCPESGNKDAIGIRAIEAKVVMFGREWPDAETTIAVFVPVKSGRKTSWALGVAPNGSFLKYLGLGHRIGIPDVTSAKNTKDVVAKFQSGMGESADLCGLVSKSSPGDDGWTVVAHFTAGVEIWLAVADGPGLYGLAITFPVLGAIDVLYRRVNDQLGIFSAEYTLPKALRTIQIGVASVRLPTFRIEIHTDGGALFDFGFPWKNDFSRSCQVEIAIFLGAGGFYYGRTSAAASELLAFTGGFGYLPPDSNRISAYRALRFGFAARVGIGRSFSIGILSAEASLTIFGGLEGAAGYLEGESSAFSPRLYGLKGYMGLMLDIRAEVSFAIITARARLLVYAMVGVEIRCVLAKKDDQHVLLSLPTVIFAEVGLTVSVDVEISIGCASVTIHLSFSATWRIEETLGGLSATPEHPGGSFEEEPLPAFVLPPGPFSWNPQFRLWVDTRTVQSFVTVLPCLAAPEDVGRTGTAPTSCVIGQMLLPVDAATNGFGDVAKFIAGFVLRPNTVQGIPGSEEITLEEIVALRRNIRESGDRFWQGFQAALLTAVGAQFSVILNAVTAANEADALASIPLWPGTTFRLGSEEDLVTPTHAPAHTVFDLGAELAGDATAFDNYARCVILGTLAEIEQSISALGKENTITFPTGDQRTRSLTWDEIWADLFAALPA